MAFDVVEHTTSAAVVTSGTFTAAYPAGKSAGSYAGAHGHKMALMGSHLSSPKDFTLTFGASSITVTWKGTTTIPAGTRLLLQIDLLGWDTGRAEDIVLPENVTRSPLHLINLGSPDTLDADGIWDGVEVGTTAVTFDSSDFKTGFTGELDVPRALTYVGSSGANHVVTVTGYDVDRNVMVETVTLNSDTPVAGKKAFLGVATASVAAGGASGDTMDIGWGDVLGLPLFLPHPGFLYGEIVDGVNVATNQAPVHIMDHQLEAAADGGASFWITSPVAGRISRLMVQNRTTVDTGGAITVEVNGTPVDGLSATLVGAAAGDVVSDTPTAAHASALVAVGDEIEIIPAGAIDGSADLFYILTIIPDSVQGTLLAGVTTAPTATTGDVRGTYTPAAACDGTMALALLVSLSDPGNTGVAQFAG